MKKALTAAVLAGMFVACVASAHPPLPLLTTGARVIRDRGSGEYEISGRVVDTERDRFQVGGRTWARTRDGWISDNGETITPGPRPGTWVHARRGREIGRFETRGTLIHYTRLGKAAHRYSRDSDAIRRSGIEDYLQWRTRHRR